MSRVFVIGRNHNSPARPKDRPVPPADDPTALPPWLWPRAAYVHVPFCAHRCGYCDFAIATGQDHLIGRYLDALAAELATLGTPRPVRTLFLGGQQVACISANSRMQALRRQSVRRIIGI
jgi:coproporphyrinogen III oxidase-like Fe-S oxidoreductase